MSNHWKNLIKAGAVRAIRTMAQTAIASVGTNVVLGQVDWIFVLSSTALAGLLSILTALAGLPECNEKEA